MSDAIAELLARYHLGLIPPREGARLAAILEGNPPDALARLARACTHLGITGEHAEHLAQLAADYGPEPARDYLAGSTTLLPAGPLAGAPAHRPTGEPTTQPPARNTDWHAP